MATIDLRRQTDDSAKHIVNAINSMAKIKQEQVKFEQSKMLSQIEGKQKLDTYRGQKEIDQEFHEKQDQTFVDMLRGGGTQQPQQSMGQAPVEQPTAQNQMPAMSLPSGGMGDVTGQPAQQPTAQPQTQAQAPQPVVIDGIEMPDPVKLYRAQGGGKIDHKMITYAGLYNQAKRGTLNENGKKLMQEFVGITPETVTDRKLQMEIQEKGKKQQKVETALKDSAISTISTINEIKNGIKYFGAMGDVPAWPAEYEKKNWVANYNRLKDKLVVDLMLQLKEASPTGSTGFGQLSEKEGMRLENAATALQKGMKEKDALRYLDQIEQGALKIIGSVSGGQEEEQGVEQNDDFSSLWQ